MARVSILMPVRNAASTVEAAARSALADAVPGVEVELVCVDDRSDDGSGERLRALAAVDRRIHIVPGNGQGIVAALTAGLETCRAPLVARMDADDLWLPGRLAAQLRALEADPTLAAVGGAVEIEAPGGLREGMRHYQAWLNRNRTPEEVFRERYVESPLVHPAVLLRRDALDWIGGYRDGPFPEDYELWLRFLAAGARLANVSELVLRWRDSPARLTRTDPRYALGAHLALKASYLAREPLVRAAPPWIWGAGRTGLALARQLRAHGVAPARFVEVDPRKIGRTLLDAEVIAPEVLGGPPAAHLLVAVGAKGARKEIRHFLALIGFIEDEHFTCVA